MTIALLDPSAGSRCCRRIRCTCAGHGFSIIVRELLLPPARPRTSLIPLPLPHHRRSQLGNSDVLRPRAPEGRSGLPREVVAWPAKWKGPYQFTIEAGEIVDVKASSPPHPVFAERVKNIGIMSV